MTQKVAVLLKAGPRQPGGSRPMAWRPSGPLLIFHSFFVQREIHAHAQICIGFWRAKWTMVSLNSFTILIIISILFVPFFPCMLLSEKRCHSLFILCLFVCLFVHFARPNLMQICACAWIYRWTKKYGKSGLGHRVAGLPGHQAFGPPGRWAMDCRPLGHGPAFSKTQKVATGC